MTRILRRRDSRCLLAGLLGVGFVLVNFTQFPARMVSAPEIYQTSIQYYKQQIAELKYKLNSVIQLNLINTSSTTTTTTTPKPCIDAFKSVFEKDKRFVCNNMVGGIGNFMFAYASAYGIATLGNRTVVIHKDNPVIKYFQVEAKVVDEFCVCDSAKKVSEKQHCAFSKHLFNLTEKTNYQPLFYLQSWKYFEHASDDIRRQFAFKDDIRLKAISLIESKLQTYLGEKLKSKDIHEKNMSHVVRIGVHVRRGDIATTPRFLKYGYLVAPSEYFKHAMAYFRKKYPTSVFLVCSDNMKWCKENIVGSDVIYMEGNSFDVDLAILSQCNHSVISVGTYGWWGAFLASGETIYYKHPVRNDSDIRKQYSADFSDFFRPDWIGMD